jgi:hypothetical protein
VGTEEGWPVGLVEQICVWKKMLSSDGTSQPVKLAMSLEVNVAHAESAKELVVASSEVHTWLLPGPPE